MHTVSVNGVNIYAKLMNTQADSDYKAIHHISSIIFLIVQSLDFFLLSNLIVAVLEISQLGVMASAAGWQSMQLSTGKKTHTVKWTHK